MKKVWKDRQHLNPLPGKSRGNSRAAAWKGHATTERRVAAPIMREQVGAKAGIKPGPLCCFRMFWLGFVRNGYGTGDKERTPKPPPGKRGGTRKAVVLNLGAVKREVPYPAMEVRAAILKRGPLKNLDP